MRETYTFMSQLTNVDYRQLTDEQIVSEYVNTSNNLCVAEMFCRYYAYFNNILTRPFFKNILEEDKASYVLEKIPTAMLTYKTDKNSSFRLYLASIVVRYIISIVGSKFTNNTGFANTFISTDKLREEYKIELQGEVMCETDELLLYTLELQGLTKEELEICRIVCTYNETSPTRIGKIVNKDRRTVTAAFKKINTKLQPLYTK